MAKISFLETYSDVRLIGYSLIKINQMKKWKILLCFLPIPIIGFLISGFILKGFKDLSENDLLFLFLYHSLIFLVVIFQF